MATMTRFRYQMAVHSTVLFLCASFLSCAPNVALVRPPESYKGPLAEQPVLQQGDFWVHQRGNSTRVKSTALPSNIRFPLWVGKAWSYDVQMIRAGQSPTSNTPRIPARADCYVIAFKQVAVAAGTFAAFECECQCVHQSPGYEAGCDTWTIWYAPEVKHILRTKTPSTETSVELIEYRASRPKDLSGNAQSRESSAADPRGLLTDKYRLARSALLKNDDGHRDFAVSLFEEIVTQNPAFDGASTLLGKGYYQQKRYNDATRILQRALAVNNGDEIAWIVFGLTQMRLGDDKKGIDSIKGGITLLGKTSTSDYRGFANWDSRSLVRAALRRTAFLLVGLDKGSSEKEDVINSSELLLRRVDEEEVAQGENPRNTPSK